MSTGDYVRQLRAVKGGPTPLEIEEAAGLTPGTYRQLEQRYRAIGSEEDLAKLAEFFQVPVDELTSRQQWTRKDLSAALVEANEQDRSIRLELAHRREPGRQGDLVRPGRGSDAPRWRA